MKFVRGQQNTLNKAAGACLACASPAVPGRPRLVTAGGSSGPGLDSAASMVLKVPDPWFTATAIAIAKTNHGRATGQARV